MNKRLAICFFGHLRTYEITYKNFLKNIIEVNKKDGWEIDIFMHTWNVFQEKNNTRHSDNIDKLYPTLVDRIITMEDIETIKQIYNLKLIKVDVGSGMFESVKSVSNMVLQYAEKHNINYDFMLYTRTDIFFIRNFKLDNYIDFYLKYIPTTTLAAKKEITWCVNNYFNGLPHLDPRFINEGDLCWINNFFCNDIPTRKADKYFVVPIKYSLHVDFMICRENLNIGEYIKSFPWSMFYKNSWCPITWSGVSSIKIKERKLDNVIDSLSKKNLLLNKLKINLQNELNSLHIKKQNLEIKNLEQDLKNKELQSFVLKKELGNKFIKNININYIDKNSAKSRIQNHLSYKLGQALITNSKSILGYIRMPFVLSYIKDKHKFEQKAYEEKIKENPNLALPPLESYPDYKEALKEKECFTYKLGEAFIKASKNWHKGGYVKFIFKDVPRLKIELEDINNENSTY
ncbi:hypothetical protein [Campylobacter canadensis]|uniref:hypothetical protein n=1 Tax=Campylobacter canadensis TaxID=449520 RepID=UPI001CCDFD4D|nr:hypothetical protein [Campylobacter canadensis]